MHDAKARLQLWQLSCSNEARDCFMRTEGAALALKEDFYDQLTCRLSEREPRAPRSVPGESSLEAQTWKCV